MLTWARLSNSCLNIIGWIVAGLGLFLVLLQSMNVFNRYFFAENQYFGLFTTFYDEVLLVGFSALFMLGSAFAFNRDAHVRVDILYAGLGRPGQASVNLIGTLIFMIPMALIIMQFSLSNIQTAWTLAESGSNGDDGVTFFWLWKTFIPAFCVLTIIGGLNHMIQNFARVTQNVNLTNIVFGLVFVVAGTLLLIKGFSLNVGATEVVLDNGRTETNWVGKALSRKPEPGYRFVLWGLIVWGARLGGLLMIVAGAWSAIRAITGQLDPFESEELLEDLDANDNQPMGDA